VPNDVNAVKPADEPLNPTGGSAPIERVEAHERVLPLPTPLRLGPMVVRERRYTVVTVHDADGACGHAFAQSRGAPVVEVVERLLAPAVAGREAADVAARWDDMAQATVAVGRSGLVVRAASLVDIALWDLAGRRAGAPLHALLGDPAQQPKTVPVTFLAGFPSDPEDVERIVADAVAAAGRGHRTIKVPRTPDPALTRTLLARLDAALPSGVGVIVDANWVWSRASDALAELDAWPAQRIAWVEDPFVPEQVEELCALRHRAEVAIAAGDELADPVHARRLLSEQAVDVLRLDVATIGGITGARPLLAAAADAGVPVSFHISPETSIHLATALPGVRDIETFDRTGNRFDPSHELVRGGPLFAGGGARTSDAPGLGFELAPLPAA
jgi:L-alanine-DL-glutamate epimerase-like enolase superfamily enzyme